MRDFSSRRRFCRGLGALALTGPAMAANRPRLRLITLPSGGGARDAFDRVMTQPSGKRPDVELELVAIRPGHIREVLGTSFDRQLADYDLIHWSAGARLRAMVRQNWLAPIDRWWHQQKLDAAFPPYLKEQVSVDGVVYALPLSQYPWGFFYRKPLFQRLKLSPPTTWEAFLATARRLQEAGVTPLGIGGRNRYQLAAWFDFLSLRLHGIAFHMGLTHGKIRFDDARVVGIFEYFRGLIEQGWFGSGAADLEFADMLPLLYRERCGMTLSGHFLVPSLPRSQRDEIGFFRFPRMVAGMPWYEDAPTDVLCVARNSPNLAAAEALLTYFGLPDVQSRIAGDFGHLPAHRAAAVRGDPLIEAGARVLRDAAATAQFFDRDAPPALAREFLAMLSRFFVAPSQIMTELRALEAKRDALTNSPDPFQW